MTAALALFDLDDTLAPSKSRVGDEVVDMIVALTKVVQVGVISGGRFEQFDTQLLSSIDDEEALAQIHVLPTCGTRYLVRKAGEWSEVYSEPLTDDEAQRATVALEEGAKALGLGSYLKANLFPPGIPGPIYILVTPIEFISTFILRPVTLTIRLLANMMAGHLLLVLFFSATWFFLVESDAFMKLFAIPSYVMGLAFTLFECLVIFLQAYIFTLLTAVYIDGATSAEH